MSEIKRVTLNTLEPQRVSDKVNKKAGKTVRISVILPESNEDNCPEYNYKDELAAVKRKSKHSKNSEEVQNGLDPFGPEDDDVRKIAMEMEEKYGNKKKRKGRKDDYADIGMGYDESDSFIDNTDGYDEIIPQNVTTLHGGFYINCGALEFKTDDEADSDFSSSSDNDSNSPSSEKHVNRKRILETSDEDGEESSNVEKKPKLLNSKNTMQQAIKKKLFSQNKIQVKKRRLLDPLKKTVKELLREKRQDLHMSLPVDTSATVLNDETTSEKDPLKENKRPMCISSVTDTIESVVKATIVVTPKVDSNGHTIKTDVFDVNTSEVVRKAIVEAPSSIEGESSHESTKIEKIEIVKLPENLPGDITEIIDTIKAAAANNKDGKVKFFTDEVNAMLLKLERKCKCLGKPSKTKVYEHLSPFVRVKKETLIRRAKNLVLEDEERKLKKLLSLLRDAIRKIMPSLLSSYESESQKILQKKNALDGIESEENKGMRMPKRRFQWTEETKKYMKDILFTKKRCLLLEGKLKESYEEQIMDFLKKTVQPLWPEGWISMTALKKICNSVSSEPRKPGDSGGHSGNNQLNINQPNSTVSIIPISNNATTAKNNHTKIEPISNDLTVSKINQPLIPSQKIPEIANQASSKQEKRANTNFDIKKLLEDLQPMPIEIDADSVIVVNTSHKDEPAVRAVKEEPPVLVRTPIVEKEVSVKETNSVIEATHCQVIDLTDSEPRRKHSQQPIKVRNLTESKPLKLVKEAIESFANPDYYKNILSEEKIKGSSGKTGNKPRHPDVPRLHKDPAENYQAPVQDFYTKHPELSVTPNLYTSTPNIDSVNNRSEGDQIQMVMENLKALQKLSSPIKSDNSTSSPVSVIAFNKNFSPKSSSIQSSSQRTDLPKTEFSGSGYQDEFQKQFIQSLSHIPTTPTSSKTNYNRCS